MHFKKYKSILSANGGMNIYRVCNHGCIYLIQEVNAIKWIMNLPILKLKPIVIWFLINNYPKKETP